MTTREDTTKDPAAKAAAKALLAKGLITRAEAAELAGISRQLARHWANEIDAERLRQTVVAKLWRKELARQK